MSAVRCSVVIPNWNGRHLLAACLDSLKAQTLIGFELIVVDNGSTDGSAEWLASERPEVRVIRLPENLGFSGGCNVGIRAARGELVALLNNDTEVDPRWLEALCQAMDRDPRIGAADSKVYFYDERNVIWSAGCDYSIAGSVTHRGYLEADDRGQYTQETDVFVAVACGIVYRRSALDKVGLFDEDFFSGYEDVDLSFRLHAAGYRVVNVPESIVYHRVSATARKDSDFYVFHGQKNVLYTFIKNMPAALLWKYLPLHVLYTAGSLVYFARIGRLRSALRAKLSVLKGLRSVLAKRRAVRALRVLPAREIDRLLTSRWIGPKVSKLVR
jgi:GT2 family glycosyltransferase